MKFREAFFLTTLQTVVKLISGILLNKVVAVYLGPSGLAMIGQFQNFAGIVTGISNASVQTGIIAKTAEARDSRKKKKIWKNALYLSIVFSILSSVMVFSLAGELAQYVMRDSKFSFVMIMFSLSIIFFSLNLYLLSILNGLGDIKLYSIINIAISLTSLLLVSLSVTFFGLKGGVLGLLLTQFIVFLFAYMVIFNKYKNSFFKFASIKIEISTIKVLLKYGSASFCSGIIVGLMMITIRTIIINNSTLDDAGIWEAASKISIYFSLMFVTPISIYYLPKFASSVNITQINKSLIEILSFFLPLALLSIFLIVSIKSHLIVFLFSDQFSSLESLIVVILVAEVFRILAAILNIVFFAKHSLFNAVKNEFIYASLFVILSYISVPDYGLQGVLYSYLVSSMLYLILNFLFYKFRFVWIAEEHSV
jgi:PST family polysaccharide transporter